MYYTLYTTTDFVYMDGGLQYENAWMQFIRREQRDMLRLSEGEGHVIIYRESNWEDDIHSVYINTLDDAIRLKESLQKLIFRLQQRDK